MHQNAISFLLIWVAAHGTSFYGSMVMNLTVIQEDAGSIPGLPQWVKDLALLWPAV